MFGDAVFQQRSGDARTPWLLCNLDACNLDTHLASTNNGQDADPLPPQLPIPTPNRPRLPPAVIHVTTEGSIGAVCVLAWLSVWRGMLCWYRCIPSHPGTSSCSWGDV